MTEPLWLQQIVVSTLSFSQIKALITLGAFMLLGFLILWRTTRLNPLTVSAKLIAGFIILRIASSYWDYRHGFIEGIWPILWSAFGLVGASGDIESEESPPIMLMIARRNATPMLNIHSLLADAGTAVGAAAGIATLLRIDELVTFFHSHVWLTLELLKVRGEKRDALQRLDDQHLGMVALKDGFDGLKAKVEQLQGSVADNGRENARLRARLELLEPRFDGAIAYIHSLTAHALRLLRILKANHIAVGIDENLPKPPDVLTDYVLSTIDGD